METTTLITVVVIWFMTVATLWVGLVIIQRILYFKQRKVERALRLEKLGAALTEDEGPSMMSDSQEALREKIARQRGQH